MSGQFETLFKPYFELRLSAFDNAKLVVSVLAANAQPFLAAEIILQTDDATTSIKHYGVKWLDYWIDCGQLNQYQVGLRLVDDTDKPSLDMIDEIKVPVMTMQQVGFMCIESAHFDHC
ncbi:hypothetical protein [Shewanella subflava]|uniref:Uncharacterized protein n=1 Tax=Shewanella subflava TaxID=2986476 RepID=A0ABT3IAX8_9GAMM|nr:hypothetical protein [Shewanella subflava]MCW3173196.1 hypothetical protein [Shewanella subflava]